MKKNLLKSLVVSLSLILLLSSCNVEYNIAKTGCKVYTYGSYELDKAGACIECDSLHRDAQWLAQRFPTFRKKYTSTFTPYIGGPTLKTK